jgi:hypothetical protein
VLTQSAIPSPAFTEVTAKSDYRIYEIIVNV